MEHRFRGRFLTGGRFPPCNCERSATNELSFAAYFMQAHGIDLVCGNANLSHFGHYRQWIY